MLRFFVCFILVGLTYLNGCSSCDSSVSPCDLAANLHYRPSPEFVLASWIYEDFGITSELMRNIQLFKQANIHPNTHHITEDDRKHWEMLWARIWRAEKNMAAYVGFYKQDPSKQPLWNSDPENRVNWSHFQSSIESLAERASERMKSDFLNERPAFLAELDGIRNEFVALTLRPTKP